jgi:hypothetical protein
MDDDWGTEPPIAAGKVRLRVAHDDCWVLSNGPANRSYAIHPIPRRALSGSIHNSAPRSGACYTEQQPSDCRTG